MLPNLQANYQTSLFCAPIVHAAFNIETAPVTTHSFYRGSLWTRPDRIHYINAYGYEESVPAGHCQFTKTADDAQQVVRAAIRPTAG
jgi:hypothetical protein